VAAIRGAGLDCYAWTVSEPAQGRRLVEWGVSGLITDRPGLMRAGLGGQWCSA
jgi:glycerophosphoryl diester phosphodiesterase